MSEKCQGHGRCWSVAPDLFESDEIGNGHELNDGIVPAGSESAAHLAADNCPEYAIELADD